MRLVTRVSPPESDWPPPSIWAVSVAVFFFFHDTATTEIYTLSLHDALPIYQKPGLLNTAAGTLCTGLQIIFRSEEHTSELQSRVDISYAVFCLKKKILT